MLLSVVLPCYNGAATLGVQLDALSRQSHRGAWELVVVNNGSTDDSVALAESYRERLPVRVVDAYSGHGPRLGVAHSYETGIAASRGEAVAFCEADDEVDDGWLRAMASALGDHPFVVGALAYDRLNPAWLLEGRTFRQTERIPDMPLAPHGKYFFGCNVGMHRSFHRLIGPVDVTYRSGWDADYCERILAGGHRIHFARDAVIQYRLRADARSAESQARTWGRDMRLLEARHRGRLSRRKSGRALLKGTARLLDHERLRGRVSSRAEMVRWAFRRGWLRGELEGIWRHHVRGEKVNADLRRPSASKGSVATA